MHLSEFDVCEKNIHTRIVFYDKITSMKGSRMLNIALRVYLLEILSSAFYYVLLIMNKCFSMLGVTLTVTLLHLVAETVYRLPFNSLSI